MRVVLLLALLACSKKEAPPPPPPAPPPPAAVAHDAAPPNDAAADAGGTSDAAREAAGKLAEVDHETIGGFALGAPSEDVVKALGAPKRRSKEETMAATGETVSTWTFDGLEVTMVKQDARYLVSSIGVKPPSKAATSRGIHLGSTRAEVEASYVRASDGMGADDKSDERRTRSSAAGDAKVDDKSLLVGSPYGGELFTFKNGVVVEIFLGQMAE